MRISGNDLVLGQFDGDEPLILRSKQRLEHLHITGLTGTGKSRYLEYLIRQDLRAWPWTKRGMLVIDPHGELFDGLMSYVAANKLTSLPIIPIDFRRQDQIISYYVLRQRASEPSVIIDNFVKAMAYVWGQAGTDATPLFERWASNLLYALYYAKRTLADAAHLFTPEGLVIADKIEDPMIRTDWLWARKNRKDFETATSSSVNRFRRFLLNPTLRSIFGQSDVSLDLGKALDEGQIVLVSLARNGGNISRENADLFATLLLSDLWASADERGKSEHAKPFYCYIDEFQRFLTPTMAESLAEARGFGIGMTLSNQFPRQILNGGPYGERIYDEVMENTRSKVVFRLRTRANLMPVAESLFMDTFDPEQVKHQHYSTKVLGHRLGYLPSFGRSTTSTHGGGNQQSHTVGISHSLADNWNHSDSASHSLGISQSHTDGVSTGESDSYGETASTGSAESEQWNRGESQGLTEGSNWGQTESSAAGGNRNRSRSTSVSEDLGIPTDELRKQLGRGSSSRNGDGSIANVNDNGRHQAELNDATQQVSLSETLGRSDGDSWSKSSAHSRGGSASNSRQSSLSRGGGISRNESFGESQSRQLSDSTTSSDTFGINESFSEGTTDSFGGSETFGTSEADTFGSSTQWSDATGNSLSLAPMLFPVTGKEADAPMFRSIEEQLFIAMAKIARLKNRQAYVLTAEMDAPVLIYTPEVKRPSISNVCTQHCIGWYQIQTGLSLPLAFARQQILDRDAEFIGAHSIDIEFDGPRRRIGSIVVEPVKKK